MKLSQLKLKHALIGLALVTASNSNLMAQGAYVNVNVGYGMPLNSQKNILIEETHDRVNDFVNNEYSYNYSEEIVNLSMGKGMNFGASFGYMFNKNLGAELGLNYLLGGKTSATYTDHSTYIDVSGTNSNSSTEKEEYSAKMFQINPTLVLAGGFEKWNPYGKFGVVLGFGSIYNDLTYSDSDGDNWTGQIKMNEGMAFGFSGAFGVQYALNENLSLFGELNLISMSYSPNKGEVTEYTFNGVDMLDTFSDEEKQIEYVDKISENSNSTTPSTINQELRTSYQFSSIGLKVGLAFHF